MEEDSCGGQVSAMRCRAMEEEEEEEDTTFIKVALQPIGAGNYKR